MLNKKTFLQGINYLKMCYPKFEFDINNNSMLNVWYSLFEEHDDGVFMYLIKEYCKTNDFAPTSPRSILKLVPSGVKTGQVAWDWLQSINTQYPYSDEFYKPKFYQELAKDQTAYKLFEQLKYDLFFENNTDPTVIGRVTYIGFGFNYCKEKFINWYDKLTQCSLPIVFTSKEVSV